MKLSSLTIESAAAGGYSVALVEVRLSCQPIDPLQLTSDRSFEVR
jgi:hypothetical protein